MTQHAIIPHFSHGESILVIGLGRSGVASTQVLRDRGVTVYGTDEKVPEDLSEAIAQIEALGARFVSPSELPSVLDGLTGAVLSPGVPLNGALVRRVQDANVPVFSEIEVAYRLCKAPIVAVTGTKGKSTTTSLIGHLLRSCGKTVHVGGNIGNPLIREVLDAKPHDWVVAEVSSFQLESIRSFRPRISVILNLSADHLDRYYSMDEYAEAKYRIFANQNEQDYFVGNLDDERVAQLHWHTGEGRVHARQLWFTLQEHHEHASMYLRGDAILYAPVHGDPRPIEVLRTGDIPLAGLHNVQNVMAALLAALAADADPRALRDAVKSFSGMAHRLQPVGEVGGVLFVDDSKATNPGSVIAALDAYERPIVLIAGGKSKNTDFTELGRVIDRRAKALVLIGEAADDLAAHVSRAPIERADSMNDAVRRAARSAGPGDVVLLSPACASFDMFRSAEDRGEKFTAAVRGLSQTVNR
ncbi:MAG TPA: UDP-N-acetylmuramoyl-L-alanine--D-glutamate ligase [Candidatus Baltobacteraceae bacterium]|nr:UDP-N-acetylmuramoyl-L-alanine--D-glutamate ligase [Candidatus Baltobacteraceae bacterium]